MFRRTKKLSQRNLRRTRNQYDCLEERKLLAVSTLFESGELAISLDTAGDVAVLTEIAGEIRVNDEAVDMNAIMEGVQPLLVSDVTALVFSGTVDVDNLDVALNGQFDTGPLQMISFENINDVTLNGIYSTGQFSGSFVGDGGMFAGPGQLFVGGVFDVQSIEDFDFVLDNASNDFEGAVNIDTGGNIVLEDAAGNLVLQDIAARNMTLSAQGTITNTVDPSIVVPGASNFTANVVNLGNNGGVVDLFAVISNTDSTFALNELDKFVWSNTSTVGFANIAAGGLVSMGPNANITVNGDAFFDVDRLRIGVGGSNTFHAERLNVNAERNAFIWENSSLAFFGQNSADDLDVFSSGDITNDVNTSIQVAGITNFQSLGNVSIGGQAGDSFNSVQIRFFANDVTIFEDSQTLIGGLANRADNLLLESNGFIRDTEFAFVQVINNATFVSNGPDAEVEIGELETDEFTAGSISFQVNGGDFRLSEDDTTNISSPDGFVNLADNVFIQSAEPGALIVNDPDSIISVNQFAELEADAISIGQMPGDNVEIGLLRVDADGNVAINLDEDVQFDGDSRVGGDLSVNSVAGAISDTPDARLNVDGHAFFVAPNGIELGGSSEMSDRFTSGSLRFVSNGGNVNISQNNDVVLTGVNNALTLRLATIGDGSFDISSDPGVDLNVVSSLFLTSTGNVDIGSDPTDSVSFDNLNFGAVGDVAITAIFEDEESEIFIFGTDNNPNEADEFRLTTNVDVFDGVNAVIDVETFLRIEARNIVLGDSDTDCVMIPGDAELVTVEDPPMVTTDESCT